MWGEPRKPAYYQKVGWGAVPYDAKKPTPLMSREDIKRLLVYQNANKRERHYRAV